MKYLKSFNENVNIFGIEKHIPKSLEIFSSNGNFNYEFSNSKNDGVVLTLTYIKSKDSLPNDSSVDEPQFVEFKFNFFDNSKGTKINVSVFYGMACKFEFSLEKPDILRVITFNGVKSKIDPDNLFAIEDEGVEQIKNFINSLGFSFTKEHFSFMDKYPNTYQHYTESIKLTPIFDNGIILVIDNHEPNKSAYLQNVLNFLIKRGINYKVTASETEADSILKSENVIGVLSTGSDYMISSSKDPEKIQKLSHKILRDVNKPVMGMCFGYQSMAYFYGSKVVDSGEFFHDNTELSFWKKDSPLFKGMNLDNFQFSVSFHDVVESCPPGFDVIAKIKDHIIGIQSVEKMRWGLGFHPEDIERTYPILDNFIEICIDHQNKSRVFEMRKIKKFSQF